MPKKEEERAAPQEKLPFEPARQPQETSDTKIAELEQQLDRLKSMRETEQRARLAELKELQERKKEKELFAEMQEKEKTPAEESSTVQAVRAQQPTASGLLGMDPDTAVKSLVTLATSSTRGFDEALKLLREVAPYQGGAWLLDQFHALLSQGKP
jgi:TolA-binding protein